MLIDTHSHIYLKEFEEDQAEMLARAQEAGVSKILMPAIDSSTHASMLELEEYYKELCMSMMGVHPCSIKADFREELKAAQSYFDTRKFVAVGEIGLDFYWDKTFTKQQYLAFHEQTEWALQWDLPVVIHSRNATDECIDVLTSHQKGSLRGVFHCFSGNEEQAQKITDLGLYLGIGGVVTFKNAGLDKVIKTVSPGNIVLETDAPYLAPVPFRGKRNEPSYLKYVADKLSEIWQLTKEEIETVTTENAKKLFRL